ncbi:hypothetical protein [Lactobacillus melliventris]|uniref:hypothetical protein n=1 Tax=Lactobacillus melliventris TaxID=1218507 RepID=UPI00061AA72B|nr:hypothetical protein [Lactobacillus melliventris]
MFDDLYLDPDEAQLMNAIYKNYVEVNKGTNTRRRNTRINRDQLQKLVPNFSPNKIRRVCISLQVDGLVDLTFGSNQLSEIDLTATTIRAFEN